MKFLLLSLAFVAFGEEEETATAADPLKELRIFTLSGKQGKECEKADTAQKFDEVAMHYTGWVAKGDNLDEKGKKFDSSRDRDSFFDVPIEKGRVIKGWDKGLVGMCVGSQRRLIIPPDMGYGDRGAGADIPGGATLIFDVELMGIPKPRHKKKRYYGKVQQTLEEYEASKDAAGFITRTQTRQNPKEWVAHFNLF